MKNSFIAFIAFLLLACTSAEVELADESTNLQSVSADSLLFVERVLLDSAVQESFCYLNSLTDSTAKIVWGKAEIYRTEEMELNSFIVEKMHFNWSNADIVSIGWGAGTGIWFDIYLPLDERSELIQITNTLAVDEKNNLIVYESSQDTIMTIYNLKNKTSQYIIEKENCQSAITHSCLDSIQFSDGALSYEWNPSKIEGESSLKKVAVRI